MTSIPTEPRLTTAPAPQTETAASARRLSRIIAVAVVCMAAVVVLGWILGDRIPKGFLPGLFKVKINTALGFVLAGYGLSRMARERPGRGGGRLCRCTLRARAPHARGVCMDRPRDR